MGELPEQNTSASEDLRQVASDSGVDTSEVIVDVSAQRPRSSNEEIKERVAMIADARVPFSIIDSVPIPMAVLDRNCQIVASNSCFSQHFRGLGLPLGIGMRPGEALNCVHAADGAAGCGTGPNCPDCGAYRSVASARAGNKCTNKCRLDIETSHGIKSVSTEITASSVKVGEEPFVLFSMIDLSHNVQRNLIDHAFFHDLLNGLWIIIASANMLSQTTPPDNPNYYVNTITSRAESLVASTVSQRDLADAQEDRLELSITKVDPKVLLKEAVRLYKIDGKNTKCILLTQPMLPTVDLYSDKSLLQRVLLNLLITVGQASTPSSLIELGYEPTGENLTFWLRNRTLMVSAEEISHFNKTFSTTYWQGTGSYTMQIITNKYLSGTFHASCNENAGTKFELIVPLVLKPPTENNMLFYK